MIWHWALDLYIKTEYFIFYTNTMTNTWEIVLYKKPDGTSEIDVRFDWDTIWLNQNQIANLFDVKTPAINKHLNNIFNEWELKKSSTISKMEIVQIEWKRQVKRFVEFYNLDAIISVWYRVNSKNATTFRIWATNVLRQHLLKWYTINQKRLWETGLNEFEKAVLLIKRNIENNVLQDKEIKWMLSLITNYAHSRILLQKYDEWTLALDNLDIKKAEKFTYEEALIAINDMRNEFLPKKEVSEMFGIERNDWLKWIIDQIYQWFDWVELYPSIQEKAAALMYFTIKNHPFSDWNKKIGAFLLLVLLWKNNLLYHKDGSKIIDENTLTALTLLVATSEASEKDMIIKLIVNFITK